MRARGIVFWGLRVSPAMSMACRKPMKAKAIPPEATAAKMPSSPSGANPPWAVKLEASKRSAKMTRTKTTGKTSFTQVRLVLTFAKRATPKALRRVITPSRPSEAMMPRNERPSSFPPCRAGR